MSAIITFRVTLACDEISALFKYTVDGGFPSIEEAAASLLTQALDDHLGDMALSANIMDAARNFAAVAAAAEP